MSYKLVCFCGNAIPIDESDFGFEELECPKCGLYNYVPETVEELEKQNSEVLTENNHRHELNTSYRVMLEGEDHEVSCLKNNLPNDELLNVIVAGYQSMYPDGRVFTEPEEDYGNMTLMELNTL